MNCSVCHNWFCLECSHTSHKMYDVLRKEQIANLPFNCDGFLGVISKLNEMGIIINEQKKQLEHYETKLIALESIMDEKNEKKGLRRLLIWGQSLQLTLIDNAHR